MGKLCIPLSSFLQPKVEGERMEIKISFDPKKDAEEDLHNIISRIYNNKADGQQKINSNSDKKVLCAKCKRDLYSYYETDEVKKIVNFCQVKYKGKVYCRDCQETLEAKQ